jgi:hypothetical protein
MYIFIYVIDEELYHVIGIFSSFEKIDEILQRKYLEHMEWRKTKDLTDEYSYERFKKNYEIIERDLDVEEN